MIKFSPANAKIEALKKVEVLSQWLANKKKVYSFDLLSGFSCPFAKDCLSKAIINSDGKRSIKDGVHTQFRCFSASQEVQYSNVYNLRKANFEVMKSLKGRNDMFTLLNSHLPKNAGIIRIHVAGDFFNQDYFLAWCDVAKNNPHVLFYAYTKSLQYWINGFADVPSNLILTASQGGRADHLIDQHLLRKTVVVFTESEAALLGLEIDHDDSHACRPDLKNQNFALLVHGTQPKGSNASIALQQLKRDNVKHSYSRK
jgi:hypothetical protein